MIVIPLCVKVSEDCQVHYTQSRKTHFSVVFFETKTHFLRFLYGTTEKCVFRLCMCSFHKTRQDSIRPRSFVNVQDEECLSHLLDKKSSPSRHQNLKKSKTPIKIDPTTKNMGFSNHSLMISGFKLPLQLKISSEA